MYYRPIRLIKSFVVILCVIIIYYEVIRFFNSPKNPVEEKNTEQSQYRTLKSNDDFDEIVTSYEPFYLSLPNFSDEEAKNWFYSSSYYKMRSKLCPNGICEGKGVLFNDSKEHLAVRIALVKNGLYLNDDCGYNYPEEAIRRQFHSNDETTMIVDQAILYPVPDGWSFQHFLDGIGPKLAHSRNYLNQYPKAKVIILQGVRFDRSVKEIWSMLGNITAFFTK